MHPRTAKTLQSLQGLPGNLLFVDPQPYLEFNYLVKHSKAVITDSGGITEESTVMGIPCMTLRDNTERPETVTLGTNELLGTDPAALKPALDKLFAGEWKAGGIPELWDGKASDRIVMALEQLMSAKKSMSTHHSVNWGSDYARYLLAPSGHEVAARPRTTAAVGGCDP